MRHPVLVSSRPPKACTPSLADTRRQTPSPAESRRLPISFTTPTFVSTPRTVHILAFRTLWTVLLPSRPPPLRSPALLAPKTTTAPHSMCGPRRPEYDSQMYDDAAYQPQGSRPGPSRKHKHMKKLDGPRRNVPASTTSTIERSTVSKIPRLKVHWLNAD